MRTPARSPVAGRRGRPYDRHSCTALRGMPKKNGAGHKGVWGSVMDQEPVYVLDKNDPNYDPDEETFDQLLAMPSDIVVMTQVKSKYCEPLSHAPSV